MREFASNMKSIVSLRSEVRSANARGREIDRLGFEKLSFLVIAGSWSNGVHTVSAEESVDGVAWTPVPAASLSKPFPVIDGNEDVDKATMVGYLGDARYVAVKVTVAGAPATGASIGAVVLLAGARAKPVQ